MKIIPAVFAKVRIKDKSGENAWNIFSLKAAIIEDEFSAI